MNPTDLPRITGVAVTSLVCKMAEVVGSALRRELLGGGGSRP